MTARTRYFVISSLLVLSVGVGSGLVAYFGGARALTSRGGPEELQYLPADASVVAYADVRSIMSSELRQRFLRAAPGQQTGQHELQELTGINVETDIDHVVAGLQNSGSGDNAASGVVLATGLFNEAKIEALMREHGAQTEEYAGKRIVIAPKPLSAPPVDPNIPNPDSFRHPPEFALSFLKPGLVALGTSNLIRRAIDLQSGGANLTSNEEVMNLVRSIDSGNAWAVGRFDALRNSARLPAGVNQLPPISLFSVSAQINDGIVGVLRADTTTDEAAKNLRDIVNGFLAFGKLQAGSKPEMQGLLDSLQISGTGKTVALTFSLPGRIFDLMGPAGNQPERQGH